MLRLNHKNLMKPIRKFPGLSFILGGSIILLSLLHAQDTATPVQSAPPDSVVQLTAESQGLNLVAPADLPEYGTFWNVTTNGVMAPWPCPPPNTPNLPIYDLTGTGEQFLVDNTGGKVSLDGQQSVQEALAALSEAVGNLINQVQDSVAVRSLARAFGMAEDSSSDVSPMFASFDTNGLWLQISGVTNGTTYLTLNNASNLVYEIYSKTDLTATNWDIAGEVFPTDTNCMPFTVPALDGTNLYIWARDWTGITSGGNTTPEWWFYKYFRTVDLSDTNLDSQGNTLLADYTNGTDPNIIEFTIEAANDYVNTTLPNLQVAITAGTPDYYAVLVNGDSSTNWLPFVETNLMVTLGTTDGIYNVAIGLRGLPADATQTWQEYSLTLDRVPPVLTITNPLLAGAAGTVIKPYLQLQGSADEPLASLSYDISNAVGVATNLDAFVTDQCFDTNKFDFTTNYFQAYDVPLATNINYITLRAGDRAGNVTTTNFTVTLDYTAATNPPVVTLIWPTDGMAVSGTNITIRGTMSDETGAVWRRWWTATATPTRFNGLVERNNMFWVENVPLNGTNQISVQATDAAGNVTTTNFTVYAEQSHFDDRQHANRG